MVEIHFIHSIAKHYFSEADAVERSYIRAIGESVVLGAVSGAAIYGGVMNRNLLEISLGVSSLFSSFAFAEISAKGFLRRYGERDSESSVQ
ncbi:MAG: hypothetical protein WCI72_01540 [archaeon]